MKKTIISLFVLLCFITLNSQLKAQEVISSAGNYSEGNTSTMSWTIGENFIETYESSANILTQGFQQSKLVITSIDRVENYKFKIKVFPNPASEIINIKIDK